MFPLGRLVRVGCGAGYQGDRIAPAVELLTHGKLDYMFLECLAERTLAIAHQRMSSGGAGYDPRLRKWLTALLPLALDHRVKLVTNMGAADPAGAAAAAVDLAKELGLPAVRVVGCGERASDQAFQDGSTAYAYLGAEVVVQALREGADLVILGRVADPSMLVGIVAFEHGWSLTDSANFDKIARATMAGHLLECGFHLTGGYFAHPAGRDIGDDDFESLARLSMPFADITSDGGVMLHKLASCRGELSIRTCSQQLVYEIGNPAAYMTPDICADFTQVRFRSISENSICASGAVASGGPPETLLRLRARPAGFKMFMEASLGGKGALKRAHWADRLVRRWMAEERPGSDSKLRTYFLGWNSTFLQPKSSLEEPVPPGLKEPADVRIRWDGLFSSLEDAAALASAAAGLALGGPAGIGGVFATGNPVAATSISRELVERSSVTWELRSFGSDVSAISFQGRPEKACGSTTLNGHLFDFPCGKDTSFQPQLPNKCHDIPPGRPIPLYEVCHARSGDKGNTANIGLIPYDPEDFPRIIDVITAEWAAEVFRPLLDASSGVDKVDAKVYQLPGVPALNIVVSPVLDGGVTVSRRVDIHGKSLSDLVLSQEVVFKRPRLNGVLA